MKTIKYADIKNSPELDHLIAQARYQFYNHEEYDGPKLDITLPEAYEFCAKHFAAASLPMLPAEFLDNERFMKDMVAEHYPITDPSFVYFVSDRLKDNKKFMSFALEKHGGSAAKYIGPTLAKNRIWLLDEMTKVRGKTLTQENGIKVQYSTNGHSTKSPAISVTVEDVYKERSIIYGLLHNCDETIISEECLIDVLRKLFTEHKDDSILVAFIKEFSDYIKYKAETSNEARNMPHSKLIKLIEKIGELPATAKVREYIYKKLLAKEIIQEENNLPNVEFENLKAIKSPLI